MTLRLPPALAAELRAQAMAAGEHECCGLLLGTCQDRHAMVERVLPIANVAAVPAREFLLDPTPVARALVDARRGGLAIVGVYHSHPRAAPVPSGRDEREAWPEWSFVILGRTGAGPFELRSYRRAAAAAPLVAETVTLAE